ncbi:MAG: xanthine dehydrogenase family protein molybdopterin-binding subunit [Hyphomicrobiales bacterium]|nr:xanthine dehydrogenase family protein molybdopterin-binding subunit [Hyphomicrobiales bacterium]
MGGDREGQRRRAAVSAHRFIGRRLPRIEDRALITGAGRFVDDIHLPGLLEAAFVRSAHAHARILSVDIAGARTAPGVVAVLTFDDLRPHLTQDRLPLELRMDVLPPDITPFPLAKDEVVFVGEAIAVVVAQSRQLAEDAAAMVAVTYEPLPAVADCKEAVRPRAARADTRKQSNIIKEFRQAYGDVAAAFAAASHRATLNIRTHRGCAHSLEGRAVLASYDALEDRLTVWDSTQESHDVRGSLMTMLGLGEEQIRVVAADVGGGFGAKHLVYPEEVVVAAVSRLLQRPVKWSEDRREHFLATIQERDQYWDMEIAFDGDGRLLGMRGQMVHDQGAYTPRGTNLPTNASTALPGPYRLPCLDLEVIVAETNKVATIPIRGAGYPSANFVMERSLDEIARTLRLDRAEIRRRNLVPAEAMPYDTRLAARSGAPIVYDSGDYPKMMATCLAAIDYAGFPARQAQARREGRLVGIGMGMGLKGTGRGPFESATVRIDRSGKVLLHTGAVAIGQGLKTALAQICAEELGVDPAQISVTAGDTGAISLGLGAFASRQTVMAGSAVHVAAVKVREKTLKVAADMLEASQDDLELRDGGVSVKGVPGMGLSLRELAVTMAGVPGYKLPGGETPGLEHSHNFLNTALTYSGAALAIELEVDAETGRVTLHKICVVNDSGRVINPLTVEGQIIGSVVHTLGNTLFERMSYDGDAQPLTTTFADYLLASAPEIPPIGVTMLEYPGANNPLGVKGAGETACIAVPGAIVSAIEDALAHTGVQLAEFPLSPARLYEIIAAAVVERA